jgi:hypothetical protein
MGFFLLANCSLVFALTCYSRKVGLVNGGGAVFRQVCPVAIRKVRFLTRFQVG